MNVPNISQGPGSVTTLPRTEAGSDTATSRSAGAGSSGRSVHLSSAGSVSFARLAWFDVNGDGEIDPRSAAAGGDATLIVPAHAIDLPTYARRVSAVPGGAHGPKAPGSERPDPSEPVNVARTNRAVEAYQRYGQAPPSVGDAAVPGSTPVVAGTAPTLPALTTTPNAAADLTPNTVAAPERAA